MSQFKINILSFEQIKELPGSWEKNDLVNLLNAMDYDNPTEIKDSELKEMCMMSLTDYEPEEAAKIVLDYTIAGRLTEGQIENLSHEILTEKLWEEYPELPLHPDLYRSTQLLYDAFNGKFPRAEAVQFTIEINGDVTIFEENPEAPIVRLLAAGMSDRSLIHRLFSDQLAGDLFAEARDILWQLKKVSGGENSVTYEIVSSAYWLDEIKYADSYDAESHADVIPNEEE
ncbi:hypothetical protein MUK70_05565 [Dyadobacter chenwenxiniae]|uniref:Uncharacterized protein n=1 Tax=Dyadobacter chenwenxiniae TaxID=2906456 RepID=A0A9X1THY4_9BACT|nr:hypothetical protein [Dyadobacter chenwenxiniae]MCF0065275.1 hypothetical protein [Dyadobacter chenwenxiniae]UON84457.1 hypothetical protein MUK70_05565 [Dyadobacter chenwenxiniae]